MFLQMICCIDGVQASAKIDNSHLAVTGLVKENIRDDIVTTNVLIIISWKVRGVKWSHDDESGGMKSDRDWIV
jgi:hypothetical protein